MIPEVVVVRLRLLVEVLPREAQVDRRQPAVAIGVLFRQGHAEGLGRGRVAPDDGLTLVRRDARRPEMVRVQIEDRQSDAGRRVDRDRHLRTAHRAADQRRTVEEVDTGHAVGIVRLGGERDGRAA